jgi:TolA-binding protein
MRRWAAAACLVSVVLLGAAPAGVSPDLRDRFIAALAAQKTGDWATAAKEFGDPAWAGTALEDYALLFQAESLQRQGDAAAARPLIAQAADRKPESGLTASGLVRAAGVLNEAGDPAGAVTLLRRVLSQYPDYPDATRTRYALGEALIGAGDQPEAARVFSALWLQAPASYGDVAARQLKALADAA